MLQNHGSTRSKVLSGLRGLMHSSMTGNNALFNEVLLNELIVGIKWLFEIMGALIHSVVVTIWICESKQHAAHAKTSQFKNKINTLVFQRKLSYKCAPFPQDDCFRYGCTISESLLVSLRLS